MEGIKLEQLSKHLEQRANSPNTARSHREDLINQFIEEINKERMGTKYPPVNKKVIAIRINRNPFLKESWQLEGFYKRCKGAKSFGSCFYYNTKVINK